MSATLSPETILREMSDLWVTLGKQGEAATGLGVLRACALTLVVVTEEADDTSALGETLAALMPEHPARSIVVRLRRNGGPELACRVFEQCWMPFGQRRQICCEQIEIAAAESSWDDVASVLAPIAAPDLPLLVWCRSGRATERPAFWQFAAAASKVVVNTGDWEDPKAALQRLAALAAGGVTLGDFSWTCLTRWREALSQVFENPQYAARLPEISRVRVRYDGAAMEVMARYMGAWLTDALANAGVRAELSLEPGAEAPSVELGGGAFRVELVRLGERLVTHVDALSRCTSLPRPTDYLLLREEMGIVRRDSVFERTLASAARQ